MKKEENDSMRGKGEFYRNIAIEQRRNRRLNESERALIETIQTLDDRYPHLLVIVEGKRDLTVLRNLGLKAPIIKTQTKLSRPSLIEKIKTYAGQNGQVLILTDFDKRGKEIYRFIEKELELYGIKNLKRERGLIRRHMEDWTTIEQLVSLFKRSDAPEVIDPQLRR